MGFPQKIIAGLDFQSTFCSQSHPAADGWIFTAIIRGPKSIDLTSDAAGGFSALAAVTTEWPAGKYWYSIRAAKGGSVVEIESGELAIDADLSIQPEGYDGRSQNAIAYEAICAVLAKRATIDQQRYVIGNRELWRAPVAELLKLKAVYANSIRREKARQSGASLFGRAIHIRFGE